MAFPLKWNSSFSNPTHWYSIMFHVKALCILAAITSCALANPAGPGEAALQFMDAVKRGTVELKPNGGTAISPLTSPQKIEQIARRLKRMVYDMGKKPLRVGQVKTEGDLAAVLIWKDEGYDPSHMQVFPVAMIKRNNQWLPAPVPASFENCDVGYRNEIRNQIQALESWMLQQQVIDLAQLQRDSIRRMQEQISKEINREELKQCQPGPLIRRFLTACAARRENEILGLIGGLSDELPENWAQQAGSVEQATSQDKLTSPWRLLMAPNVLRVQVLLEEDANEVLATYACLDTEAGPIDSKGLAKIQLVNLNLAKSKEGFWQIHIPDFLWQPNEAEFAVADENLDKDLLNQFSTEIRKLYPAQAVSEAEKAIPALLSTLQQGSLLQLMPWIHIDEDPDKGRATILHAAQLWGKLHGLGSDSNLWSLNHLLPLDSTTNQDLAVVTCQVFSVRKPDRFDPITLYLRAVADTWMWEPQASTETQDAFKGWVEQQHKQWQINWREHLIRNCPVVERIPVSEAPAEGPCRELIQHWIKAVQSNDISAALGCCARLKAVDSPTILLRNLGYEFSDTLKNDSVPNYHHFLSNQGLSVVGLKSNQSDKPSFPLYPIVMTSNGPRILLEIDLIGHGGRGRDFLNRSSLTRLSSIDANAAKVMQSLFNQHEAQCLPPKVSK